MWATSILIWAAASLQGSEEVSSDEVSSSSVRYFPGSPFVPEHLLLRLLWRRASGCLFIVFIGGQCRHPRASAILFADGRHQPKALSGRCDAVAGSHRLH